MKEENSSAALETLFLYLHFNKTIEGHSISSSLCFSFFLFSCIFVLLEETLTRFTVSKVISNKLCPHVVLRLPYKSVDEASSG